MNDLLLTYVLKRFEGEYPSYRFLWRHDRESHGDLEVDACILEAFNVPDDAQRDLVRSSRELRREAAELLGRKIILGTHTPEATQNHYEDELNRLAGMQGALQKELKIRNTIEFPMFQQNGLAVFGPPRTEGILVIALE